MRTVALLCVAVALTACAAPQTIYLRADGQDIASDPLLRQQLDMDQTICQGEQQKASLGAKNLTGQGWDQVVAAANRSDAAVQVRQGCMAEKGYVAVPEDQAAAKRQELAAVAAEKARREAAAAPPPPPPPVVPQHATLKPKPKPKPKPEPQPPQVQPTPWPPQVQPTPQPPPR